MYEITETIDDRVTGVVLVEQHVPWVKRGLKLTMPLIVTNRSDAERAVAAMNEGSGSQRFGYREIRTYVHVFTD